MNAGEPGVKLKQLLALPAETEWVEFKKAQQSFPFHELGEYFSALSNEANLKGEPFGWLVFGVQDRPRMVGGTHYRPDRPGLDSLKKEIADKTTGRLTFVEIHEVVSDGKRVLLFQIPAALPGVPTAWEGHYYGREGESVGPLNLYEQDEIRGQANRVDWSAQIVEAATLTDLDPAAIAKAREQYGRKHPDKVVELTEWDDTTFLNKAKILKTGRITNAALLLLGRDEAAALLEPAVAKITWVLRDEAGMDKDYQHFGTPFLLSTDEVFSKIRNRRFRYMKDQTLFPTEIDQYEPWVIREALHNCIAHQDYALHGKISVVEESDSLLFANVGSFLPRTVERVIEQDAPPDIYRSPFLADAMVQLNMIDTIGSGIKRMFQTQRRRFFPLPDYDLTDPGRVRVRLFGKILDENYTRALILQTDLSLYEVMALDKVQKRLPLSDVEFRHLKRKRLIEGRRPSIYVASHIAAATGKRAAYIKNRAFDKAHYKQLVLSYLAEYGSARRNDLEALLIDKLSDALTAAQKRKKIGNLLQEMARRDGSIRTQGIKRAAKWLLTNPGARENASSQNQA